jgi:hypothetical protein
MWSRRRNKILVQVRYHCTQETLPSFTFYICTQYRANHESQVYSIVLVCSGFSKLKNQLALIALAASVLSC